MTDRPPTDHPCDYPPAVCDGHGVVHMATHEHDPIECGCELTFVTPPKSTDPIPRCAMCGATEGLSLSPTDPLARERQHFCRDAAGCDERRLAQALSGNDTDPWRRF